MTARDVMLELIALTGEIEKSDYAKTAYCADVAADFYELCSRWLECRTDRSITAAERDGTDKLCSKSSSLLAVAVVSRGSGFTQTATCEQ